jgi:hypothetical protein
MKKQNSIRMDEELINLRPMIKIEQDDKKPVESFQNDVLRPVLKYQHELLELEMLNNPIFKHLKSKRLNPTAHRTALQKLVQTPELKFRCLGLVLGLLCNKEST